MNNLDTQAVDVVNALFNRLVRIKPAFKQAWPTEHEFQLVKRDWVQSFERHGVHSIERIKRGVEKLTDSKSVFIPSPGEFIELCKAEPEDIGAPIHDKAYLEAIKNSYPDGQEKVWSHEAVRLASQRVGSFFLRNNSAVKTRQAFDEHYTAVVEDFSGGRIMKQIEGKRPTLSEIQDYTWHKKRTPDKIPDSLKWVEEHIPSRENTK